MKQFQKFSQSCCSPAAAEALLTWFQRCTFLSSIFTFSHPQDLNREESEQLLQGDHLAKGCGGERWWRVMGETMGEVRGTGRR